VRSSPSCTKGEFFKKKQNPIAQKESFCSGAQHFAIRYYTGVLLSKRDLRKRVKVRPRRGKANVQHRYRMTALGQSINPLGKRKGGWCVSSENKLSHEKSKKRWVRQAGPRITGKTAY